MEKAACNGEKPHAFADGGCDRKAVEGVAAQLGIAVVFGEPDADTEGPVLRLDETGLSLTDGGLALREDFSRMLPRLKPAELHRELLVRAAKLKPTDDGLSALDATAGLGEDSLLLAAAGFRVTLCERNPVIAALLRDALRRAAVTPELAETAARMRLEEGDSTEILRRLEASPDVVYLDPMFPKRRKSALVKKKFQLLHCLEQPCRDECELLEAAIFAHPRRIVIKRPAKEPYLAGKKPSYSIEGDGIRFDCIVLA